MSIREKDSLARPVRVGMPGALSEAFIALAVQYCSDISATFHLTGVHCRALIDPRMTPTTSHLSLLLARSLGERRPCQRARLCRPPSTSTPELFDLCPVAALSGSVRLTVAPSHVSVPKLSVTMHVPETPWAVNLVLGTGSDHTAGSQQFRSHSYPATALTTVSEFRERLPSGFRASAIRLSGACCSFLERPHLHSCPSRTVDNRSLRVNLFI